jgi:hypothetical protein
MKRDFHLSTVALAAGLLAFGAVPTFSQGRPSPSPSGGGGEHAASRPSGGGESSSPSGSSGGGSSTPSSGGSSVGSSGGSGGDHAISRGEGRRSGGGAGVPSRSGSPRSVVLPSGSTASDPGDRRAPSPGDRAPVSPPDYARTRGGRPVTGRAVERPRDISNVPGIGWRRDPYFGNGYWYPCYPAWGGYCYYDPYWWDYYYGYGYGYGVGGGYYDYDQSDYDTGGLKLKVKPRDAQVYVDGYFSGVVDDYDGVFQRLKLRAGAHRVELRADGFQPAVFDVLIVPGETVTYRTELKPR